MVEYRKPGTLSRMYWGDRLSTYQIAEHFDISDTTVRYWMDAHGIERRDYREATTQHHPPTDPQNAIPVHVDDREPPELLETIHARTAFHPHIRRLKTGDLVFPTHDATIERKRLGDAVESISNGRLWTQLDRINDEFDHGAVIITGQYLHPIKAQCHNGEPASIRSVMTTIAHINEHYDTIHAVWLPGDDIWGYTQLVEYVDRWLSQIA